MKLKLLILFLLGSLSVYADLGNYMDEETDGMKLLKYYEYYISLPDSDSLIAEQTKDEMYAYLASKNYPYVEIIQYVANYLKYDQLKMFAKAEIEADKALDFFHRVGLNDFDSKMFYARITTLKAEIRLEFNDYKSVVQLYSEALNIALDNDDNITLSIIYYRVALLMLDFPELEDKALKYINQFKIKGGAIFQEIEFELLSVDFLHNVEKNKLTKALDIFHNLEELASGHREFYKMVKVMELALAVAKNDNELITHLIEQIDLLRPLEYSEELSLLWVKSIYYSQEKDVPKQIANLKQAIQLAIEHSDILYEQRIRKDLFVIYNKVEDVDNANEEARKIILLNDSIGQNQAFLLAELDRMIEVSVLQKEKDNIVQYSYYKSIAIWVISILFIVVVLASIYIYKQDVHLQFLDRKLYEKNKQLLSIQSQILGAASQSDLSEYSEKEIKLLAAIEQLLTKEKIFLREDIKLVQLAQQLNATSVELTILINKFYQKSFSSLINEYRVKRALNLLENNQTNNFTIEQISSKSGFKSRTAFYKSFKDYTGLLPSYYLKNIQLTK